MASKYLNIKETVNDIKFDSKKEARRYVQLASLQRAGLITDLECQPEFKFEINGKPLKTNKKGSRQLKYIADFRYVDTKSNQTIVEDVKSKMTEKLAVFTYKRALMWTLFGIEIIVV